jgi:uncharacterized tellurite resistance protein B-like protein
MGGKCDKLNCIKNLMYMMCCDGSIGEREKKFLKHSAKELNLEISDWNGLLKEVLAEKGRVWGIEDRAKAVATLKSLLLMAKADKKVDEHEKRFLLLFSKSMGLSNAELTEISKGVHLEGLFDTFKEPEAVEKSKATGVIVVLKDGFEKLNDFVEVANQNNAKMLVMEFDEFISGDITDMSFVCFHASDGRDETVARCKVLLEKCGDKTVSILTRYQGHLVKYMLEIGLKKCIIEPIYANDLISLFS